MFLEKILAYKHKEIGERKKITSLKELKKKLPLITAPRSFKESLTGETIKLIGEIKKASPSKGLLCKNFNVETMAFFYEKAGVSAISVLTDEAFFQGSPNFLKIVKERTLKTPVLCKDFIIDSYQLIEARVMGADAVLLIAASLKEELLAKLIHEAESLQLTPLVEVHSHDEARIAIRSGAAVIGINNRDLKTFSVDLNNTFEIIKEIPPEILVVSESGIKNRSDMVKLHRAGVHAALVGEAIVTADNPIKKIQELLGE